MQGVVFNLFTFLVVVLSIYNQQVLGSPRPRAQPKDTVVYVADTAETDANAVIKDADLVIAFGTHEARLPLVWASRTWRGKVRTLVALESEALAQKLNRALATKHNEHYVYWPDRSDSRGTAGDIRVALMPWLVHKTFGSTYKWILYGDDDTVWFTPGVKVELAEYDHKLPYVVTDSFWWRHDLLPSDAPRCLPCHRTAAQLLQSNRSAATDSKPADLQPSAFPPVGCPCTPDTACKWANEAAKQIRIGSVAQKLDEALAPDYPGNCEYASSHGGSGLLISVGAMEKISFEQALVCMYGNASDPQHQVKPGSVQDIGRCDRRVSLCLWTNGVAFTDPGYSFVPGQRKLFDQFKLMDNPMSKPHRLEAAVSGDSQQLSILKRLASTHLGTLRKQLHKQHHGNVTHVVKELAVISEKIGLLYFDVARQLR